MRKQKESVFKGYWQTPTRNKIAVIVIILLFPIALLGDLFSWLAEKFADLDNFIVRWMEIWTGMR
jgi:hypothetical protein